MAAYSWLNLPWVYNWWQRLQRTTATTKTRRRPRWRERIDALHLADLIPQMYVRTPDGQFVTNSLSTISCQSFYRPSDSHARGIASVISFDLLGNDFFWDADHVVSNWPTFYESQDRFVIAEIAHDYVVVLLVPRRPRADEHPRVRQLAGRAIALHRLGPRSTARSSISSRSTSRTATSASPRPAAAGGTTARSPRIRSRITSTCSRRTARTTTGRSRRRHHVGRAPHGDALPRQPGATSSTYKYIDPLDHGRPHRSARTRTSSASSRCPATRRISSRWAITICSRSASTTNGWGTTNISMFDVSNFARRRCRRDLPIPQPSGWTWSEAMWEHKAFTVLGAEGAARDSVVELQLQQRQLQLPLEARADLRRSDERHALAARRDRSQRRTTTTDRATGRTSIFAARCSWATTSTRSATRRSPFIARPISERLMNKCYRATSTAIGGGGGECVKCRGANDALNVRRTGRLNPPFTRFL